METAYGTGQIWPRSGPSVDTRHVSLSRATSTWEMGGSHICCPETPQVDCQGLKRTMLVKNELLEGEVIPCHFEFTLNSSSQEVSVTKSKGKEQPRRKGES